MALLPRILLVAAFAAALPAAAISCGAEDDLSAPPPGAGQPGAGASAGGPGGTEGCVDGATVDCHLTLGEHEGVVSCYDGVQTCVAGEWGPCGQGVAREARRPGGPGSAGEAEYPVPLSLSDAGACANNPCDPSCQVYDENPDGGVTPDASGGGFDRSSGALGAFPPGHGGKGVKAPCSSGADCQFDYHCDNPKSGTCAHHKCAAGAGLTASCDPCVSEICAAAPSCCTPVFGATCAHTPCAQGAKLKSNCDGCVAQICAVDPYCCNTLWDAQCAAEVQSVCGKSCNGGSWTQACVDKVKTVCGAFCEEDASCAHDKCYSGAALSKACDPCVTAVCNVDPSCCGAAPAACTHTPCSQGVKLTASCHPCVSQICSADPYCCNTYWDNICTAEVNSICGSSCPLPPTPAPGWSSACVAKVASVCGETCPAVGQCNPWLPGETDPDCPGVNLTVGVPCTGSIPVCNVGNTTAPAGIKLVHFPANSQQYPLCSPNLAHPQIQTCTTTEPIPPGLCIDVTGCPGLVGNREIMVNPAGPGHIAECSCKDNWSLYNAGSCQLPSCSGAGSTATFKKVNMFVTVDKSGSMSDPNRWVPAMNALKAFFGDPSSAGLGVALRFWPDNSPSACGAPTCSAVNCSQPLVPLGTLTVPAAPIDTQEQALINAINSKAPGGMTPMSAALAGATLWASNFQQANPNEQAVVVLITDGQPTECDTNVANIAGYAANAFNNFGVATYVIGIAGVSQATIDTIAQAGGGQSFFIAQNGNTQAELLAAMKAIQGDAVSCTFDLPNAGLFDPNNITVEYTPSNGPPVPLAEVSGPGACGAGWYLDDPQNPTKVTLCPSTCSTVQADTGASVQVIAGCPGVYQPVTYQELYAPSCAPGQQVQWGFFAYDTVTPGDSNVVFQVRTAATQAGLASAPLTTVATAKATPNTQVCPMGGPAPCPIDLFTALGGLPKAQQPFLELVYTLNPTTGNTLPPTVQSWEITYSCPFTE